MILNTNIDIRIISTNLNKYRNLGYSNINVGDLINIPIELLAKKSHYIVNVKCDICGNEKKISYKRYLENINKYNIYACSVKCAYIKNKKTNLEKYGVEYPSQNFLIKEKVKKTNLEKYGVVCTLNDNNIKEKVKKTNLEKYGVEYASQSDEIKNKVKKTNLEKYGVNFTFQSEEIKEKIKEKNLEKYGVEYASQSDIFKNNVKQTILEKYGNDNIFQTEYLKNKSKQTNLEKYGVEYASQSDKIKNKVKQTNLEKYNTEYYTQSIYAKNIINVKKKIRFEEKYNINILKVNGDFFEILCNECKKVFEIKTQQLYNRIKVKTTICTECNPIGSEFASGYEIQLQKFIKENYFEEIIINKRNIIYPYELDIYIPELKLAFEFNGVYWHNELYKTTNYHKEKSDLCEEKGIQLIHIWEDDWLYKQDIVKSMILNKINKVNNKIFARKCKIKEVESKISKDFLNNNHIQGFIGSPIRLGLYYNDELVSLMTFGKKRLFMKSSSKEGEYELLRFCNKINTSIIGGASRLFKYFLKNYNPKQITTYADRSYSNGNLYKQLGFKFVHKTEPNYYYVIDGIRKHRFGFRKDVLVKQGFDSNKTEHEIMMERSIYKIYNAGNLKYEKII